MTSSAEIYILTKCAELAIRCGLRPSDVDTSIHFVDQDTDPTGRGYFTLNIGDSPNTPEASEKREKFYELLGVKSALTTGELEDFETMVDRALELAPRARVR